MDSLVNTTPPPFSLLQSASINTDSLICSGKDGITALGQYTDDGMVVLKGSKARLTVVPSFEGSSPYKRRIALQVTGDLVQEGDFLVFQRDVEFGTPSGASDAILGRSSNGWIEWRNGVGVTLDALVRQPKQAGGNG